MHAPNQEQPSPSLNCFDSITSTTFNILAPIYKRLNSESLESEHRECWLGRNKRILDQLLHLESSIVCLQEFWVGNEELVNMYEKRLGDAGYATYKLARTNNRGDGLLTAVYQQHFHVLDYRQLLFNDFGDRVAQLLHVKLLVHHPEHETAKIQKEALVVNTHLMFPHDSSYSFHRLKQVYKILQNIESYIDECRLLHVPIILCGDWNGSRKGHVYKFLQSQGFISSYDVAHRYNNSDENSNKWISHRNHRGNVCGVDFVWLRNPRLWPTPLKKGYMEAIFGNLVQILLKVSKEGSDPPNLFECDGGNITYSQFSEGLTKLGLCVSDMEIKQLWEKLDPDRDGLVELSGFDELTQRQQTPLHQEDENEQIGVTMNPTVKVPSVKSTISFNIERAMLYPPEVEKGIWPEGYSLSDHALLSVEFRPVNINVPTYD